MDLAADGTEGAIGGTGGRGGEEDDDDDEDEDALTSSASAEVHRCLVVGWYPGSRRAGIGDAVAVVVVVVVAAVVVVVDMRCCECGGEVTANGRDDEKKSDDDAATSRRRLEALPTRPAIVILRLIVMIVFEIIRPQVSMVWYSQREVDIVPKTDLPHSFC